MPKFRKKPVVIEAEQFQGVQVRGVEKRRRYGVPTFDEFDEPFEDYFAVDTASGEVRVYRGDWICRQTVNGKEDVWPVKADIFSATYEPLHEVHEDA